MPLMPDATLASDRYGFVRDYLASHPAPASGGALFDIGAGALPMKGAVEAAGYTWSGFDLAPKSADITQWDINTPFVGAARADLVLLMDVLEHTFNPGIAMRHVRDVLKPVGKVILTVPNPRWSRARTMHLVTGCIAAFTQHDLDWNHHVFATWPHIVQKLALDSDFVLERYVTLDLDEGRRPSLNPVRAAEQVVRRVIEAKDPSACGMSYAFILSHGA